MHGGIGKAMQGNSGSLSSGRSHCGDEHERDDYLPWVLGRELSGTCDTLVKRNLLLREAMAL